MRSLLLGPSSALAQHRLGLVAPSKKRPRASCAADCSLKLPSKPITIAEQSMQRRAQLLKPNRIAQVAAKATGEPYDSVRACADRIVAQETAISQAAEQRW